MPASCLLTGSFHRKHSKSRFRTFIVKHEQLVTPVTTVANRGDLDQVNGKWVFLLNYLDV